MTDDTSAALEWLRDMATKEHRKWWLKNTARALLAHIADLTARAERAEDRFSRMLDYNIDLQRIVEALSDGRPPPEPKTAARHHFNLAVGAQHRAEAAEKRADALAAEVARLREALEWYGEQARLARLIHSEGDAGRNALASDGGRTLRQALAATPEPQRAIYDDLRAENEQLRHDIERATETNSGLATENERLRALLREVKDAFGSMIGRAGVLRWGLDLNGPAQDLALAMYARIDAALEG